MPLTKKKIVTEIVSGVLLVNKPVGMTSHDVVDRIRRITGQRRIGHAGTLDPLASGLLVVCLGSATKISRYLTVHEKSYRGTVRLGQSSKTYDREGIDPNCATVDVPQFQISDIEAVLDRFRGTFQQQVPAFSAVSVAGKRLHELARKGEEVATPTREVTISELRVTKYNHPDITLEITCSKGTYIRSLAHDIGQSLGCGAYLESLSRTSAGRLRLGKSLSLDEVEARWSTQRLRDDLLTIGEALELPALVVSESGNEAVSCGKDLQGRYVDTIEDSFETGEVVLVRAANRTVLAVGEALCNSDTVTAGANQTVFKYARVLI